MGFILDHLNKRGAKGNFVILFGPPDSGKSNLMANIIKIATDDGFETITSISMNPNPSIQGFIKAPSTIHYITGMEEMLRAYVKCKGKILLAIDDAQGTFDSRSHATTKKSKILYELYIHLAKVQMSLIFVAHDPQKVPSSLQRFKPMTVELLKPGKFKIWGIPNITFPYPRSPYEIFKAQFSGFKNENFPLDELFNQLSKLRANSNDELILKNKLAIAEFLDEYKGNGKVLSNSDIIRGILLFAGNDLGKEMELSQRNIAERLGVSEALVSRIKKELSINTCV